MPSRRLVVTALALAAAVTGCGSSSSGGTAPPPPMSPAAYRQSLHNVAQEEARAQHAVNRGLHAKTVQQLRAALTKFENDQTTIAAALSTLHPPANAVAANTQLAHAFADNGSSLHAILPKLDHAKTVKQALGILQRDAAAQKAGQQIDAALKKLKQLGYTSGS